MTTPSRIYDAKNMAKVAELFSDVQAAIEKFEGGEIGSIPNSDQPLYVFTTEIVVRHRDNYTVGRIGLDDFLFFEITDEHYGEKPKDAS